METRTFGNILALRGSDSDSVWGFHTHNMEFAEISEPLWSTLQNINSKTDPENLTIDQDLIRLSELKAWSEEKSPDTLDALDSHQINTLSLNVVQICNLRCTYCAAGGDGTYGSATKKLDLNLAQSQIRHFILSNQGSNRNLNIQSSDQNLSNQSANQNLNNQNSDKVLNNQSSDKKEFHIQFLGGEPLLHTHIIQQLCNYANLLTAGTNTKVSFSVTTNGTLITQQVAEMLARYGFTVVVSIDGDADTNDRTRPSIAKNKSSTEMTLNGIKKLLKVREQLNGLKVNSVFGSHNLKILEAYEFLISVFSEWDEINLMYANNDRNSESFNTRVYLEQMKLVAQSAFKRFGLKGLIQIRQFELAISRVAAQTRLHSYCGAGKSLIQADTNGDLYACNWFMNDTNSKIGSGTEIDDSARQAFLPSVIEINNCQKCWARHFCAGGCMYVHKNDKDQYVGKDPHFCERTRELGLDALFYLGKSLKEVETLKNDNQTRRES